MMNNHLCSLSYNWEECMFPWIAQVMGTYAEFIIPSAHAGLA
jgi:hypothetical protein